MNRRNAMLSLTVGSLAATSTSLAQSGGNGGGPVGTNLRALLTNSQTGDIVGTFDIKRFAAVNGGLQALGTLTATDGTRTAVTSLSVPVIASAVQQTLAPTQDPPSCPILHLAIGAIDLNLLGLVITTNPIVIDIVAVPGTNNLLGNLLCTITGLLNPGGTLTNILNQLVGLLNNLLGNGL